MDQDRNTCVDGCPITEDRSSDCEKNKKHISGIVCNVTNCVHHDCETHCTAKEIAVGPSYATTSQDTVCATFKQKKD